MLSRRDQGSGVAEHRPSQKGWADQVKSRTVDPVLQLSPSIKCYTVLVVLHKHAKGQ